MYNSGDVSKRQKKWLMPQLYMCGGFHIEKKVSFIISRIHCRYCGCRIDLTFHKLEKKINKVIDEYDKNKGMTIGLSKDLGVITHYIADYFTFPHNIEYPGTMTEHIHYEAQLKVDFREFVRKMKETHAHFQEVNMRSADEICAFIKKCHTEYLHAVKSVENDCRYILQICAQVVGSILHLLQQNSMPLGCYM